MSKRRIRLFSIRKTWPPISSNNKLPLRSRAVRWTSTCVVPSAPVEKLIGSAWAFAWLTSGVGGIGNAQAVEGGRQDRLNH